METDLDNLEFDDTGLLSEETVYDEVESYYGNDLEDLARSGGWS